METLEKIFGGVNKVKTMRLFLFNPQSPFDLPEIARRTKIPSVKVRREVRNLENIGLIKKKIFMKENLKEQSARKRASGWSLNEKFTFLNVLQNFLINITSAQNREIVARIKKVGNIKLLILSGVFLQEWDSRLDILIVGEKIRPSAIISAISDIESEVGKELKYAFFETQDFLYRLGVCDKLIRDVLDYPHEKVINKMEI